MNTLDTIFWGIGVSVVGLIASLIGVILSLAIWFFVGYLKGAFRFRRYLRDYPENAKEQVAFLTTLAIGGQWMWRRMAGDKHFSESHEFITNTGHAGNVSPQVALVPDWGWSPVTVRGGRVVR